jgi:hypothetical protein
LAVELRPEESRLGFNRSLQHGDCVAAIGGIDVARIGRPGLSDERRQELWDRWAAGESISAISRGMGKPPGSVWTILRSRGGCTPPHRRIRPDALRLEEREEISRGVAAGALPVGAAPDTGELCRGQTG